MNKSVCENCILKCIVVSLEKNPRKVDLFQAGLPEYPLNSNSNLQTGSLPYFHIDPQFADYSNGTGAVPSRYRENSPNTRGT